MLKKRILITSLFFASESYLLTDCVIGFSNQSINLLNNKRRVLFIINRKNYYCKKFNKINKQNKYHLQFGSVRFLGKQKARNLTRIELVKRNRLT